MIIQVYKAMIKYVHNTKVHKVIIEWEGLTNFILKIWKESEKMNWFNKDVEEVSKTLNTDL